MVAFQESSNLHTASTRESHTWQLSKSAKSAKRAPHRGNRVVIEFNEQATYVLRTHKRDQRQRNAARTRCGATIMGKNSVSCALQDMVRPCPAVGASEGCALRTCGHDSRLPRAGATCDLIDDDSADDDTAHAAAAPPARTALGASGVPLSRRAGGRPRQSARSCCASGWNRNPNVLRLRHSLE